MSEAPEAKIEPASQPLTEKPEGDASMSDATPKVTEKHPDVLDMENALERGDFRCAREIAQRLADGSDEDLRAAGRAMLARFQLDPYVLGTLAFTGALIIALAAIYLGRH